MLETAWESRWLPDLKKENARAFHYIDATGINQWLDESRNWFMQWLIKISQVIAIWPYIVPWKLHIESKRILILLDFKIESIVRHPNYSNKIYLKQQTDWAATLGSKVWKVNRQLKLPGLPARTVNMVKLIRAQGGCLGTKSRRKTW